MPIHIRPTCTPQGSRTEKGHITGQQKTFNIASSIDNIDHSDYTNTPNFGYSAAPDTVQIDSFSGLPMRRTPYCTPQGSRTGKGHITGQQETFNIATSSIDNIDYSDYTNTPNFGYSLRQPCKPPAARSAQSPRDRRQCRAHGRRSTAPSSAARRCTAHRRSAAARQLRTTRVHRLRAAMAAARAAARAAASAAPTVEPQSAHPGLTRGPLTSGGLRLSPLPEPGSARHIQRILHKGGARSRRARRSAREGQEGCGSGL